MALNSEALQFAERLYESGHMLRAETMCRDLLQAEPDDDRTLRLLALIAYQNGRVGEAINHVRQALNRREDVAEYHSILATSYRQLGQLADAAAAYRRATELAPDDPEAHNNLGACLFDQQLFDLAVDSYERAITLAPDLAAAHYNMGNARQAQGRHDEAIECYSQALRIEPTYVAAWSNLGAACHAVGQRDRACEHYKKALALAPQHVEALNNLGVIHHAGKQYASAVACYQAALAAKPDYLDANVNLGLALKEQGRFDEAIECYQRVIDALPDCAEAHNNLGVVLQSASRRAEAVNAYRRAIELHPMYAEARCNLGALLREEAALEEAVAQFREAIVLQPKLVEAHVGLGDSLSDLNEPAASMKAYDQAIEVAPDHAEARFSRSLALLRSADFEQGWHEFEWRWKTAQLNDRELPVPQWDGNALEGRTILIHAEQGIGDTFQFIRYLPFVKHKGGHVVFACAERLHPLLRNAAGIDEVVSFDRPLPTCDCHAPLLALPRLFRTTLEAIPAETPYLRAEDARVEHWREQLGEAQTTRIGVCWKGNPDHRRNHLRSFAVEHLSRLAAVPDVTLISLQRPDDSAENQADGQAIIQFPQLDHAGAFLDSAAIITNLDLVITCDTSIAHLAGALGTRTWVALDSAADWRWLAQREDSPWYPTMRLFRQTRLGEWDGVFQRMAAQLQSV